MIKWLWPEYLSYLDEKLTLFNLLIYQNLIPNIEFSLKDITVVNMCALSLAVLVRIDSRESSKESQS
jgi:hypothetical protein